MKKLVLALLVVLAAFSIAAASVKAAPLQINQATQAAAACEGGHHFLAKTRFVLSIGVAVGLFHRYIYKPYKAGAFKSGASGRTKAFVKAGASGATIILALHKACVDAQAAGGTLAKLVKPITLLETQIGLLAARLKSGHFNPTDIGSAETAITAVGG